MTDEINRETKPFLDALYRALREHQTGTLARSSIAVGALDIDRSSIIVRVEALIVDGDRTPTKEKKLIWRGV